MKLTDEEKEQQAAIDVEAVRAKMASKGLIEGAPHGTTILDTAAAETRSEGQQPARQRKARSDKGQPKKPGVPQQGDLKIEVGFAVNIATPQGQEDMASLLAVWVHNGRTEELVSLFSHLTGELVQARKEIERLKSANTQK